MEHAFSGLSIIAGWQRSVRRYANKKALCFFDRSRTFSDRSRTFSNRSWTFSDRSWTYAELDQAAKQVATELIARGFIPGDRLAAYGKNSDAYLITFLACIYTGIIHVPVNFGLKEDELDYIIQQSGAKGLIYDPKLANNVRQIREHCQYLTLEGLFFEDENSVSEESPTFNISEIIQRKTTSELTAFDDSANDCVQIMYTSGTTSLPKGAVMTNTCLMTQYISAIMQLDIKASDYSLAALPLYHTAQMHAFTLPSLLVGATTVLIESPDAEQCLSLIEQHHISSFFAPPTVWIGLLQHQDFNRRNLSSLKKLYYGAAAMPEAVVHELLQRLPGAGLYNCYGQTEMSPLVSVLLPHEHIDRPASAGRAIFFVETRIVDENMNDVPVGERGEIVHRSPQVMKGYWQKPKETAEAFTGDWFHSGDIGTFDSEGYLYIVDRIKDVINTGGVLVASREVEEVLYQHPAVAEVAVIGTPHKKWIEAVTAVVVLKDNGLATEDDLIAFSKRKLAAFKIPKQVVFVDQLPKNASGKVLKRKLRECCF